jgi:hypothetical protein
MLNTHISYRMYESYIILYHFKLALFRTSIVQGQEVETDLRELSPRAEHFRSRKSGKTYQ